MEWPKTKSDSSAKMQDMGVPNFGDSPDRITEPGFTTVSQPLGDHPIKVTKEVKYKEYEDDKRMTEDFAAGPDNGDKTSGYDGTSTMMPAGEPPATFIDKTHSAR